MKIEVFSDELNSRIRGAKLNGERVKEKLLDLLNRLNISQVSGGSSGFIDNDMKTLIMMFQIVWSQ